MKNITDEVKFLADIESQIALLQAEEQSMYKANRTPPQFLHKALAELYNRAHKMREAQQQVTLPMSFDHLKAVFKADKDMQHARGFLFRPQEMQDNGEPICPGCGEPCNHTPQEMQGFAYDALEQASKDFSKDLK